MSIKEKNEFTDADDVKCILSLRLAARITERTIDKKDQQFLIPEYELEGWWTSLRFPRRSLTYTRATSKQYQDEIKTNMDL